MKRNPLFHLFMFLAVMLVLSVGPLTFALQSASKAGKLPSSKARVNGGSQEDLIGLMGPPNAHQTELYSQAMQLLSSLESSPSCNRLATVALLTSCQTLEGSTKDLNPPLKNSEAVQDEIKSIYAARLAVCELLGASAAVPLQCSPLIPSPQAKGKSWFKAQEHRQAKETHPPSRYDDFNARQLGQCLTSLESRPQWWTSYSNARQNAIVMCQAVRSDIDKDELLALHNIMAGVTMDLSTAMSKTLHDSNIVLEDQKAFSQAIEDFRAKVLRDLVTTNDEAKTYFGKLLGDFDAAVQGILRRVYTSGEAAEAKLHDMNRNIAKSNNDVDEVRRNVARVFQQVVEGGSELAASQSKAWEQNRVRAVDIQQALELIRARDIQELVNAFGAIHNDLRASSELINIMYRRQGALDERLSTLNEAFKGLETRTNDIQVAQMLQAETQSRLHESFRTEMNVAHGLIAQVSTSAANLHSALEDAIIEVKKIGIISGMGGIVSRWGWLSVLLIGTAMVSRRAAGCIAIGIGITCAAIALNILERLSKTNLIGGLEKPFFIPGGSNFHLVSILAVTLICVAVLLLGINYLIRTVSSRRRKIRYERFLDANKGSRQLALPIQTF